LREGFAWSIYDFDNARIMDIGGDVLVSRGAVDQAQQKRESGFIVNTSHAIKVLSALAQDSRLAIYRLLVQEGPEGMAAGTIAERLDLAGATLSFHLKELAHADLISARQDGRFIYYSANYDSMNGLIAYLTDNCCGQGSSLAGCRPAIKVQRKRA